MFLRNQIKSCQSAIDIVGLIPRMKHCKNKKTFRIYYDKAKEVTFYTTDETNLGILKTNFVNYPSINHEKDSNFGNFILRRYVIIANSYNRLLMLKKDIDKSTDLDLIYYYEETLKLFRPTK